MPEGFASYFDRFEPLCPVLGPALLWRPVTSGISRAPDTHMNGAVARKP